jgi:hypothetical protein
MDGYTAPLSTPLLEWTTPLLCLAFDAAARVFILAGEIKVVENLVHEYESGLAL